MAGWSRRAVTEWPRLEAWLCSKPKPRGHVGDMRYLSYRNSNFAACRISTETGGRKNTGRRKPGERDLLRSSLPVHAPAQGGRSLCNEHPPQPAVGTPPGRPPLRLLALSSFPKPKPPESPRLQTPAQLTARHLTGTHWPPRSRCRGSPAARDVPRQHPPPASAGRRSSRGTAVACVRGRLEKRRSSSLGRRGPQRDPSAMALPCRTHHENAPVALGDTPPALGGTTPRPHRRSWRDLTVLLQLPPAPPAPAVPPRGSQRRCRPQPRCSLPRAAPSALKAAPRGVNQGEPLLPLAVQPNRQRRHHLCLLSSCPCASSGELLFWGKDNVPVPPFNRPQLR